MSNKSLANCLKQELRSLELLINRIGKGESIPSQIDIDLALDKTREVYDLLLNMDPGIFSNEPNAVPDKDQDSPVISPDPVTGEENLVFEPESLIHKKEDLSEKPGEEIFSADNPMAKDSQEEQNIYEKSEPIKNQEKVTEKQKPINEDSGEDRIAQEEKSNRSIEFDIKTPIQENNETTILADKYNSTQEYINQSLARKQNKTNISTRMQTKSIPDLRNSIGINEKFLFIRELFNGSSADYNTCIDRLERADNYDEAMEFLNKSYSWEEKADLAQKFITLIKRKHQVD